MTSSGTRAPTVNAAIARELLSGTTGPVRDAVLLNAAGALVANEQTSATDNAGLTAAFAAATERAAESIDSGAAARLLDRWAQVSGELADK